MQMRKPLQICSTARRARIILVLVVSLLPLANLTPYSAGSPRFTPNVSDPTVWSLVWSDEFNGPNGSGVDTAKWVPETGGSGWGNNELQYYRMLGTNIDQVGWPTCGEMDIMENIGREPSVVHGTIHGPGYSGGNGLEASYSLSNGKHFADAFHTFAMEW